ncbi:MAG TPA: hypothetical protein DCS43_04050, partial [Verrucomicrobia bacterium]|nr:hypothetical protein [Verrucomicrobiota bacterium]
LGSGDPLTFTVPTNWPAGEHTITAYSDLLTSCIDTAKLTILNVVIYGRSQNGTKRTPNEPKNDPNWSGPPYDIQDRINGYNTSNHKGDAGDIGRLPDQFLENLGIFLYKENGVVTELGAGIELVADIYPADVLLLQNISFRWKASFLGGMQYWDVTGDGVPDDQRAENAETDDGPDTLWQDEHVTLNPTTGRVSLFMNDAPFDWPYQSNHPNTYRFRRRANLEARLEWKLPGQADYSQVGPSIYWFFRKAIRKQTGNNDFELDSQTPGDNAVIWSYVQTNGTTAITWDLQ